MTIQVVTPTTVPLQTTCIRCDSNNLMAFNGENGELLFFICLDCGRIFGPDDILAKRAQVQFQDP